MLAKNTIVAVTFLVLLSLGHSASATVGFKPAQSYAMGTAPEMAAVADFNTDGKPDFATANFNANNLSIRLGDNLGGFSSPAVPEISAGATPRGIAIGDFNRDGKQDLAAANYGSGNISIRLGNNAGGFVPAATPEVSADTQPQAVAIGDFNGDGRQDFAAVNNGAASASIRLGSCSVLSAAGVTVAGRVRTATGEGIRNARVSMTDQQGVTRTSVTNAFGYYSFTDVTVGGSYVVGVESRRFHYSTRIVQVTDTLVDVDFTPME